MDAYFDRIINDPKTSQVEKDCLCLFLMEDVTGARASDCINLSTDNIRDGKLVYISKKTKQKSVMPVHRKLLKYLKYKPTKDYSRMSKSRVIKRVAKLCGIDEVVTIRYRGRMRTAPKYEFISTHTGRRNFASHLALRGAPITEICQFMNHKSNINQTMRYIVPDLNNVSNEAMGFFGQ
jgi:integrase